MTDKEKSKRIGKIILKSLFVLALASVISMPFMTGGLKDPGNPLSHKEVTRFDTMVTKVFTTETVSSEQTYTLDDLPYNIKDFVETPEGGVDWKVFGETKQNPYSYKDDEGMEWSGVRPEFSENLKKLDGTEILIQGYMFPLGQEEKQPLFLLGPFPVSCPFHYHVTPNLIIEVHAKTPLVFEYDAVNIKGKLELVPKDDENNVFYRLKDAELVK
jgi:hypothetical protein